MSTAFGVLRDLRLAIHSLRRSPGFTLIAVVTLALGIGANTSAFSILNALLLRPLPYPDSGQLDRIFRATAQNSRGSFSPADYLDLKSGMNGYGEIAAYGVADMSVAEPGKPAEVAPGLRVSANLFSTLGIQPRLGRSFRADETILGNHRILVISHRYWQNRFGGEAHVVGRTVRVDGEAHEIVGVLPDTFNDWRHLGPYDVFRPLGLSEAETRDRDSTWIRLVGRRSSTLTGAQADRFVADLGRRLAADHPAVNAGATWRTRPIIDTVIPENAPGVLGMLIGLSGFVLLIACSNLANLLLARTMARAREFALRTALGASRTRLLRPLVVESLLLAFAGCVGATYVASWTNEWLNAFSVRGGGEALVFALDWRVLVWGFGACLFTALAFGVAPALFALRLDLNSTLKSGARGTTGDRGHQRFRHFLIVGQFAFAMVLLAGAALFGRGLHELNDRRYGWESDQLITGTMLLSTAQYPGREAITDFQRLAVQRLEALPGVSSASISYSMPFFGLAESRKYLVAGREIPEPGHEPVAVVNGISPRYFETVGTRLLSGRSFDDGDTLASPRVFIINQAMARGLFGAESPLGRRIAQAGARTIEWGEVVGVVGDVQSVFPDRIAVSYQLYQPMAQEPRPSNAIAVRTAGIAPSALADSIRTAMAALDPDLPLRQLQPAEASIARARQYPVVIGSLLSFLAVLGLALASLGIYGVMSRTVAQRTSEFGIRIALGARAEDIIRLVLTSGSRLALVGSSIGLLGATGVSRLIAAGWPGMQTSSLPVLTGVTLLLMAIAQVACYVPARHASRISPTEALRAE
jgi:predicted permease